MFGKKKVTDGAREEGGVIQTLKGIFGANNDEPVIDIHAQRAAAMHDAMMRIKQAAIARLPRVDGVLPGAVMDGLDDSGNNLNDFAAPNMSDGIVLWYAQQSFISNQMCAIVAQHWLVNKACSQMPRDSIRKGYKILADDGNELDPKIAKRIETYDRAYNLKQHAVQFARKGRIFGIRICLFKVNSPDPFYYEKPFNIHGVMPNSYRGMVQIDPYWCAPLLDREAASDPVSAHFYEPTYWLVNGKKYHRSHLCIFINDEVMDFLKPSYIYGGVPLPQQIMERVYAAERTANEGPALAMTKRTLIMKVNSAKVMANKAKFDETMQWFNWNRDNYQVRVIDKDEEELTQIDTALSDLDKVIMNQYQLVSAIARTPSTKLLGTQPTGFNANGDYETDSYHEECESLQDNEYRPLIDRHHQLVIASSMPKEHMRVRVEFNPLDAPTEKERADTNYSKAQSLKLYFDMGAIDSVDVNEFLRTDPTSGLTSITPAIRSKEEESNVDAEGNPVREIADNPAPSDLMGASPSDGTGDDDSNFDPPRQD